MSSSGDADGIFSVHSTSEPSSATTRITTPEASEDLSLDSGISRTENLDFVLDPISHNEALRVLEIETAHFCGLQKMDPIFASDEATDLLMHKCINILKGCQYALHNLRDKGFCGSILTVLTENRYQPGIAEGVHVTFEEIDALVNQLRATAGFDPDYLSVQLIQRLAAKLLNYGINQEAFGVYSCLTFLCRALSLGIVSFAGSHAYAFDRSIWGRKLTDIPVGLGCSFARRQLACLDEFVGGPVWVLGPIGRVPNNSRMMLSLTVQDLQQLWGPVWMVGGTEDVAPAVRTERGFIIPAPKHEQKINQPNEIVCHWTTDLPDFFLQGKCPEDRIFMNTESRLVIGLDEDEHKMGISVNKRCLIDISLIQQQIACELKLPGTCKSHYVGEGYEINLTSGYQVNIGLTKKYKRMPTRTHKSVLIAYCASPDAKLLPVLKLQVGLEVSACTGNSRRVSLWDVIQLSQAKQRAVTSGYTQAFCDHPIGSIECISTCWAREDRGQIDEVIDLPGDESLKTATARRKVINAIIALEQTGVNHEGWLQAFWPFSECPQVCRIGPNTKVRKNNWLGVVKDTPDSSTFAVVSQRCLAPAYSFSNLCFSGCFQQHIPQTLPTALCTRVFIEDRNGRMEGEITAGNHLRVGETSLEAVSTQSGDPPVVIATAKKARLPSWFGKCVNIQEHINRDNGVSWSLLMIIY